MVLLTGCVVVIPSTALHYAVQRQKHSLCSEYLIFKRVGHHARLPYFPHGIVCIAGIELAAHFSDSSQASVQDEPPDIHSRQQSPVSDVRCSTRCSVPKQWLPPVMSDAAWALRDLHA